MVAGEVSIQIIVSNK